jgi:hypothetical protein
MLVGVPIEELDVLVGEAHAELHASICQREDSCRNET